MIAIISSMTKKERRHPDLLNGSRRARVARGSGTQPADVNRLLKQYMQMEKMMSKLASGGMKGLMRQMRGAMKGMGGQGLPMPGARASFTGGVDVEFALQPCARHAPFPLHRRWRNAHDRSDFLGA